MHLQYEGEPIAAANLTARFEKVVNFVLPPERQRKSATVLFNGILGIEELDLGSEDF
jgi:hypothetical protein